MIITSKRYRSILVFLLFIIIPSIMAFDITFNDPTEISGSYINRDYITVNVTSNAANTTSIMIELSNVSGHYDGYGIYDSNEAFHNFSNLDEGFYYFNATAEDNDTNVNYTEIRNVTIDLTYPGILFNNPTQGYTNINNITFDISVIEENFENITFFVYNSTGYSLGEYWVAIINYTPNVSYWIEFEDGIYYYNATTYDKAGNFNYTELWNITINTTITNVEPAVTMHYPENNSNSSQTYVMLNVTVYDSNLDNMTVWFYGDNMLVDTEYDQPNGTEVTHNWTSLTEGLHNWTVIANDGTSNSTYEYYYFIVDSTAPLITVSAPSSSDTTTYLDDLIFNITAQDARLKNITLRVYNSTYGLVYNRTTIANSTQSEIYIELSNKTDGTYHYNVTAYDTFGNLNISRGNITIDTSPPTITLHSPKQVLYTNSSVLINFSVDSSSNFTCYYTLNGQDTNISNCTTGYTSNLNATSTTNTLTVYVNSYSGHIRNETIRFMVGNSSNTLESHSQAINITHSNYTNIFIPANISLTQIRVESNNTGNDTIKAYFMNISSNNTQSRLHLINALNITRNSTTIRYAVEFPNNTDIIGPDNWTGEFWIPTNIPANSVSITPSSGMTVSISKTMIIGYGSRLNLSKAIKINFSGEGGSGKIVGHDEGSGTIIRISNTCPSADNLTLIDSNLTGQASDCSISSGNDLIVWTRHLSRYVTFTESAIDEGDDDGGRTSGGGSSSSGDYVYFPDTIAKNITGNDTDKIIVTEYITRNFNGSKTININKQGMPLTYISLWINHSNDTSNNLDIISQSNNPYNHSIAAEVYRYIMFNTSLELTQMHNITIRFKLSKTWISQNNLSIDNITMHYLENDWRSINTSKYSEDTGYIYYSSEVAKLNVLATLAIGGPISLVPTINVIENESDGQTSNFTEDSIDADEISDKDENDIRFFSNIGKGIGNFFKSIPKYISDITTTKNKQSIIILGISFVLTLMLVIAAILLLYKNLKVKEKEPEKIEKQELKLPEIKIHYEEEPPAKEAIISSAKIEAEAPKPAPMPNNEMYVKKIDQLLNQCEYSLDNGKLDDAKKYYTEARDIYFNSNLDYKYKVKVYTKIIELKGKMNRSK
ncbi:MAG: PGF-pre-PGF domain-containing protein [Candidatus Woesearchaeota archaeon]